METKVISFSYEPHRETFRKARDEGRLVYIGRRPELQEIYSNLGVDWGNRAPGAYVDKSKPDRMAEQKRAVEAFRKWVHTQPHIMGNIHLLKGKTLICHCEGYPCHGDVLKELADNS